MTFLQLVQQFYREMGYSGPAPTTVVGQTSQKRKAVDWIAEADFLINSRWVDWDYMWSQWTQATVSGTANYAAPADIGTWDKESFYLNYTSDSYAKLNYISYKEWREQYRQGTQTNDEPNLFTVLPDKSITLQSPPDGIYTIYADYWKEPTKMTADADTPEMPDRFQRIIIVRAKIIHAEHFENQMLYQQAIMEYGELLERLEADQLPDRYDMHSQSLNMDIVVE